MPKYERKAPAAHAGKLPVGTMMENDQGVMYKVVERENGTTFWKECGTNYKGEVVGCSNKPTSSQARPTKAPVKKSPKKSPVKRTSASPKRATVASPKKSTKTQVPKSVKANVDAKIEKIRADLVKQELAKLKANGNAYKRAPARKAPAKSPRKAAPKMQTVELVFKISIGTEDDMDMKGLPFDDFSKTNITKAVKEIIPPIEEWKQYDMEDLDDWDMSKYSMTIEKRNSVAYAIVTVYFRPRGNRSKMTSQEVNTFLRNVYGSVLDGWGEDPQASIVDKRGRMYDSGSVVLDLVNYTN